MNPGYWQGIRSVLRDLRAGELRVLIGAVTIAVAAMTAVGFFTDRVSQAVAIRSAEVLAADLVLRSNRPIENTFLRQAEALGLATATVISFPSVVVADNATSLADIEAVGDGYPLRGRLRTRSSSAEHARKRRNNAAAGALTGD